jgi:SAM-dependent methyltransferase
MFSLSFLKALRLAELDAVQPHLPPGSRILEIGAGTGEQSGALAARGFDVVAVDLPDSAYAADRVFPILDYDGRNLPLEDASVDVVFSSNVLEHVRDLAALQAEIRRVLRPGGICLHLLPTHAWRFWTSVTAFPVVFAYFGLALRQPSVRAWYEVIRRAGAALVQPRHGERGIGPAELWLFHPRCWRRRFRRDGFAVIAEGPVGLFYTGNMLLGPRLGLARRQILARRLGSACHYFKLALAPKP